MKKRIFTIISIIALSMFLTACTDMGMSKPTPEKTKTPAKTVITPNTIVKPTPDKTADDLITPMPTPDTTPDNGNNTPDILPDTLIPTPDDRIFNKI